MVADNIVLVHGGRLYCIVQGGRLYCTGVIGAGHVRQGDGGVR